MEDVLTTYALPYDADYPQVCLDEKLVTLHADVVEPLPVQPGQPERVDYEYERGHGQPVCHGRTAGGLPPG